MYKCVKCGNECENIDNNYKIYCCSCVPARYVTKPVGMWMCTLCALRLATKNLRKGGKNE